MRFFNKLFGSKNKQDQPSQETTLTDEEKRQEELNRKFHSIFPYFKQLLPSDDNSISEILPGDFSKVDKQKTYSIPGLNLMIKNICDDLNCLYVYDNESGLEIIQERELHELNISKDELHEIAMENYRQLVSQRLNAQSNGEAFWFILDGNLEAGLVLVDEIWDQVEGHLKEEIVICVPSRDVIIATGKSNENVIADFTEKAKQILTTGDHPLSNNWFIRQNKKWNVFRKIIA
jgi:uncharacterized protein YtpQ (UPF0354 family)